MNLRSPVRLNSKPRLNPFATFPNNLEQMLIYLSMRITVLSIDGAPHLSFYDKTVFIILNPIHKYRSYSSYRGISRRHLPRSYISRSFYCGTYMFTKRWSHYYFFDPRSFRSWDSNRFIFLFVKWVEEPVSFIRGLDFFFLALLSTIAGGQETRWYSPGFPWRYSRTVAFPPSNW